MSFGGVFYYMNIESTHAVLPSRGNRGNGEGFTRGLWPWLVLITACLAGSNHAASPGILSFGGPVITSQPVSQAVKLGDTATFTVSATGSGLVYSWFHNGTALPGQNNSMLVVPNAQPDKAGIYYAHVLDNSGRYTQSDYAKLTIPGSELVILSGPENQKVLLGTDAVFFVSASVAGVGPIRYQWLRNGTAIPGATEARLAIPGLLEVNTGSYMVRVTTPTAAIMSEAADLTYGIVSSVSITSKPMNQGVFKGQNANFSVTATAQGPMKYVWRHHSARLAGANEPSLSLLHVQPRDAGEYWVTITGPDGTAANASATLEVYWLEIGSIPSISLKEGTASPPIPINLTGDLQSVSNAGLTAISSNPELVSADDLLFGGSGSERFLIVIAKPNSSGVARLTVTAKDRGQIASTELTVTVNGINTPPVISNLAFDGCAVLGEIITIPFLVSDKETDASALAVEARLIGPSILGLAQVVGDRADRILVLKAESPGITSLSAMVTVRDAAGAIADKILTIPVAGPALRIIQDGHELVISYSEAAPSGVVEYRYLIGDKESWRPTGYVPSSINGRRTMRIPAPLHSTMFRLRY